MSCSFQVVWLSVYGDLGLQALPASTEMISKPPGQTSKRWTLSISVAMLSLNLTLNLFRTISNKVSTNSIWSTGSPGALSSSSSLSLLLWLSCASVDASTRPPRSTKWREITLMLTLLTSRLTAVTTTITTHTSKSNLDNQFKATLCSNNLWWWTPIWAKTWTSSRWWCNTILIWARCNSSSSSLPCSHLKTRTTLWWWTTRPCTKTIWLKCSNQWCSSRCSRCLSLPCSKSMTCLKTKCEWRWTVQRNYSIPDAGWWRETTNYPVRRCCQSGARLLLA